MSLANIDFGQLYREHYAAAARKPKPAAVWDSRAAELGSRMDSSNYADEFIRRMNLDGAQSLLDVGCGPGTICLPLASQLQRVIGLDFSAGMLDALRDRAAQLGLAQVETLQLAWEDDWSAVPVCDIVVASRSSTVADMEAALHKLNDKARQRVYLTHLVGGHFIDAAVLQAIGRDLPSLPDSLYILNILHQMGIHPRLDYIEQPGRLAGTVDFDDCARRVAWSLGELNADELNGLRSWYERCGAKPAPMRWAFISWDKG